MSCEAVRGAIGAYVVGALDEAEAADVRAHLAQCAACAAEHDELSGLPALLRLVPVDALEDDGPLVVDRPLGPDGPPAPPGVLDRALAGAAAERARARRRRRLAAGVAGGLAAAAATTGILVVDRGPHERRVDTVLVAEDAGTGVHGEVDVRGVGWGSLLQVRVDGVPGGERCSLVAVDRSGGRETAATWAVPAGGYKSGRSHLEVPGGVSFKPGDVVRFEVVTLDGRRLLTLPYEH